MLVISRRHDERLFVGPDITITIVQICKGYVRLGIDAPKDITILREEIAARDNPKQDQTPTTEQTQPTPLTDGAIAEIRRRDGDYTDSFSASDRQLLLRHATYLTSRLREVEQRAMKRNEAAYEAMQLAAQRAAEVVELKKQLADIEKTLVGAGIGPSEQSVASGVTVMAMELTAATKESQGWKRSFDAQHEEIRRLSDTMADHEDAIERLREIGRAIGCEHINGPDERNQIVRCVEETVSKLESELAAAKEQLAAFTAPNPSREELGRIGFARGELVYQESVRKGLDDVSKIQKERWLLAAETLFAMGRASALRAVDELDGEELAKAYWQGAYSNIPWGGLAGDVRKNVRIGTKSVLTHIRDSISAARPVEPMAPVANPDNDWSYIVERKIGEGGWERATAVFMPRGCCDKWIEIAKGQDGGEYRVVRWDGAPVAKHPEQPTVAEYAKTLERVQADRDNLRAELATADKNAEEIIAERDGLKEQLDLALTAKLAAEHAIEPSSSKLLSGTLHVVYCNANHDDPVGCPGCSCPSARPMQEARADRDAWKQKAEAAERNMLEICREFNAPTEWEPYKGFVSPLVPFGRIRCLIKKLQADRDRLAAELVDAKHRAVAAERNVDRLRLAVETEGKELRADRTFLIDAMQSLYRDICATTDQPSAETMAGEIRLRVEALKKAKADCLSHCDDLTVSRNKHYKRAEALQSQLDALVRAVTLRDAQAFIMSVAEGIEAAASEARALHHRWAAHHWPILKAALAVAPPQEPDEAQPSHAFSCPDCGGHTCRKNLDGSLDCLGAGVVTFSGCPGKANASEETYVANVTAKQSDAEPDHSVDVNKKVEPASDRYTVERSAAGYWNVLCKETGASVTFSFLENAEIVARRLNSGEREHECYLWNAAENGPAFSTVDDVQQSRKTPEPVEPAFICPKCGRTDFAFLGGDRIACTSLDTIRQCECNWRGTWAEVEAAKALREPMPGHIQTCGTAYRGCDPKCPKEQWEQRQAAAQAVLKAAQTDKKGLVSDE